jgi:hypothetical protein
MLDLERTLPVSLDVIDDDEEATDGSAECPILLRVRPGPTAGGVASCALVLSESRRAFELEGENVEGVVGVEMDDVVEAGDVRIRPS